MTGTGANSNSSVLARVPRFESFDTVSGLLSKSGGGPCTSRAAPWGTRRPWPPSQEVCGRGRCSKNNTVHVPQPQSTRFHLLYREVTPGEWELSRVVGGAQAAFGVTRGAWAPSVRSAGEEPRVRACASPCRHAP